MGAEVKACNVRKVIVSDSGCTPAEHRADKRADRGGLEAQNGVDVNADPGTGVFQFSGVA